jgi:hypothetical protein
MVDSHVDPESCEFFVKLERTLWEAVMHRNSDALAKLLAHDYIEITLEGKRVERREIVSLSPQVDDISVYAIDLPKVTLLGENSALLTYHLTLNGHCRGEPLRPRERWATSIWTQADDQWWCRFFQQSAFSVNHDSSNRGSP